MGTAVLKRIMNNKPSPHERHWIDRFNYFANYIGLTVI